MNGRDSFSNKRKISDFNQRVSVSELVEQDQADGSTIKSWRERYNALAHIRKSNTTQAYANGMDEKDTLYTMVVLYEPGRAINITDRVIWGSKILKPVGDCLETNFIDKRVYEQTLKHSGN